MNLKEHRDKLRKVSVTGHQIHWMGWLHHFADRWAYIESESGELRAVSLELYQLKFMDVL